MRKKSPNDIPLSSIVAFFLSALITAFCIGQMKPYPPAGTYWWLSFMIVNLACVIYGIRKGNVKSDPANGLVIALGPLSFFFWTIVNAWNKYWLKKEQRVTGKRVTQEAG